MSIAKTRTFLISTAALAALLSGCATATTDAAPEEAAIAEPASAEDIATANRADPLVKARFWGEEYSKDPSQLEPARSFAQALRDIGSHERAAAIATDTLILHPSDYDMLMILGRSQLSQNKTQQAVQAFGRAIQVDRARADAFAALGLAYDRSERHDFAQRAYQKALEVEPGRTSTLSNYGMSLALTGNLTEAEAKLREAAAQPGAGIKTRQNLALVLGLQGKYDEMKAASVGAPQSVLDENIRLLKQMNGDRLPQPAASSSLPAPAAPVADAPTSDQVVPVASTALEDVAEAPEAEAAKPPAFALRGSLE